MDLYYEVETKMSFDEVINKLESALQSVGFGILWRLDFKDKLAEKGLAFDRRFMIFEACNPKMALEVLSKDIQAGYLLPCKLALYEEKDYLVLGLIKPTHLVGLLDNPDLKGPAGEVEASLIDAINKVVA